MHTQYFMKWVRWGGGTVWGINCQLISFNDIIMLIRNWCSKLDGSAGFTSQVFDFLAEKKDLGDNVIVSLMIDEMSIMTHVKFDGERKVCWSSRQGGWIGG